MILRNERSQILGLWHLFKVSVDGLEVTTKSSLNNKTETFQVTMWRQPTLNNKFDYEYNLDI